MYKQSNRAESGQAIVLLAVALVGLLGFAALALDGGNVYTEQRRAQAAADAAVMSAAYGKMDGATDTSAMQAAALAIADRNGYDNNGTNNWVTFSRPPTTGTYAGNADYMEVAITRTLQTALIHFVYPGPAQVTVHATARGIKQEPPMAGYAIISLKDCIQGGDPNLEITGGGNSGGIQAYNGGIWINSTETGAGNACGLDPGESENNFGITSDSPVGITSVGSYNYAGADKIEPAPINTGGNGGVPLSDPLGYLPEPTCTGNGSGSGTIASPYQPGNYAGPGQPTLGSGILYPGIYCINGGLRYSGKEFIEGYGVLLAVKNGGSMDFSGQAYMTLWGPDTVSCFGAPGLTISTCSYLGLAFFGSRTNCGDIFTVGGNGNLHIVGTVYAPCATFNAHGGGNTPDEVAVLGQVIVGNVEGNGNGSFSVFYSDEDALQVAPFVTLIR